MRSYTRRVQYANWIVWTVESRLGKVLKIIRVVVWEQVFEGWHQLDLRYHGPLFL